MKKILSIIILMSFIWWSFASYIDQCCIINTINYRENLKKVSKKIKKYPNLARRVDNTVSEIVYLISKNKRFKKNKLKIYSTIINRVVDYVYNHNIQKNTPSYLMLSYLVYRIKDLYEYEKNSKEYLLESTLENIDKNPYSY